MAKRPIEQKKIARLRKLINRRTPPAYIDLVRWLKDRGYAQTTGEAARLMVDGKVRVGSHAVGRERRLVAPPTSLIEGLQGVDKKPQEQWVPAPLIHAGLRSDLVVQNEGH